MSYITGLSSIEKGQRGEIFFDKGQFIFATDFATDPYFEDELNWKRIALHFKDPTNGQTQIIILKDDGARGWFAPSSTCRTGIWEIEFIEIYDKQGDVFRVERTNMPSPGDFDIDVQRKVPPASLVDSVPAGAAGPELLVNGDFGTGDLTGWTANHAGSGSASVTVGNRLLLDHVSGTSLGRIYQVISVAENTDYNISYDVVSGNNNRIVVNENTATAGGDERYRVDDAPIGGVNTTFNSGSNTTLYLHLSEASSPYEDGEMDNFSINAVQDNPNNLTLEAGEAANWSVGFKCRIWDDVAGSYVTNDVYEIIDITGEVITFDQNIQGNIQGKTLRLRFPEYTDASGVQASLYQYVSQGF